MNISQLHSETRKGGSERSEEPTLEQLSHVKIIPLFLPFFVVPFPALVLESTLPACASGTIKSEGRDWAASSALEGLVEIWTVVFEAALMGTGDDRAADADAKEVDVAENAPPVDVDRDRFASAVKADAAFCSPIGLYRTDEGQHPYIMPGQRMKG